MLVDNPHTLAPVIHHGPRLEDATIAVVALHGRDLGAPNALELARRIDAPGVAFVIPEAADRTWYPGSFMAPLATNQPRLDQALAAVDGLVRDLGASGFDPSRIVLLGFSQGACLALEWFARHPVQVGGVIAFTGGLIGPPGTRWAATPRIPGTSVLLTTSDVDTWVPLARVQETEAALTARGARVELDVITGRSHEVSDREITAARSMLGTAMHVANDRHPVAL